jgi:hypothetical protein
VHKDGNSADKQNHIHVVPSISLIMTGTELLHRNVKRSNPDWRAMEDTVTYLYEILSDVNGLMEVFPAVSAVTEDKDGGEQEPQLREVKSMISRTAQRIRKS